MHSPDNTFARGTAGGTELLGGGTRSRTRLRAELVLRVVGLTALVIALLLEFGVFTPASSVASGAVIIQTDSARGSASASLLRAVRASLLNPRSDGSTSTTGTGTGAGTNTDTLGRTATTAGARSRPDAQPGALHLNATRVPGDTTRALWFAARQAGVPISWTDSAGRGAIAIDASAMVDPRGGVNVRVAAPNGSVVTVRDSIGLIDSLRAGAGGARVTVGRVSGSVVATANGTRAFTSAPAAPIVRRLLVYGQPGWEAKFTVAALEERGWTVEVRYALGRNVTVTQGAPVAPDTARYAAVIALDSSALPHVAAIRRYALAGGGVVIAGAAATVREFGNMLPGRAGALQPGVPGGLQTDAPLSGVAWRPIVPDSDAAVIALSSRTAERGSVPAAAVVARRYGAGRVLESAYDGVWEWRMAGPEGGPEAHREWWSELVSAVAFAPEPLSRAADGVPAQMRDMPGSSAPYADLWAGLGPPSAAPPAPLPSSTKWPWEGLLMFVTAASLVAEWASRRLRGAR